ncbi:TIGR03617 family F420-dependent LLM class oxidoreductase [Galbitalea sp. SE-J8]|uniref:TIGR03617 family F420-dependent LLM class oxidoreductase n=1 Tax=Galbitalea sp. SE-J8 TaxID=3054952 RepID=UPI00259C8053|nr:TIGR03617 family F420-dependent LLM class oxidoreductase [Galbitalea sp. SE-J8]MDM4764128.1 TIGR03617 family F420-dependent LLM class oxidoreductase [Galbitalea sp. SE-J8]
MRFDTVVGGETGHPVAHADMARQARELERLGYGGIHVTELTHDAFVSATVVALATERAEVGTQIAVAFARNPMTVAVAARDLADLSGGRFSLGLGTQVAAHIIRRFSMPWSRPAARMAEFIAAVRAIWSSWQTGERLRFDGEFYRHTLMTPAFSPGPAPHGLPPIHLAAVGERMAHTAGRHADGVLVHPFSTPRYLAEVLLPAVDEGLAAAGRDRADFVVSAPPFVVSGATDADRAAAADQVRSQIAFYGSTPAYRGVLELHGCGELADALHALSVSRDPDAWRRMADLIDDDVLGAFAIVAAPDEVLPAIEHRYAGLIDRAAVGLPAGVRPADWARALAP